MIENASPLPAASPRSLGYLLLAIAIVIAAGYLGQVATYPEIPTWYASLRKPGFTPPNWLFPVAWTTLFALMAYAFWRVLRLPEGTPLRGAAVLAFAVQIVLNAAWPWAFFAAHAPWFGMAVIIPFLGAIIVTWALFRRIDAVSGWCLVPYIAWVSYASALNLAIALMNA